MLKKIFFILSIVLTISIVPKHLPTAEAAKCSTKQECNAVISDAQSQISDLKKLLWVPHGRYHLTSCN